jgi:dipeptidyl aminopeptidase/acylaminoacyl peptidase
LTGCRSKVPQPVKTTLPLMPTRAVSPLPETPLSASPTPENTPLPERVNSRLITPMNAADVTQLARLGQGMVNGAPFYSMDGELLVIPTSIGIDFYEAKSLHKVASIPHLTDGEFTLRPVDPRLVALSPGRDLLVANLYTFAFSPRGDFQEGSMQQMLYMWDLSNGSVVWKRPVGLDTFLVDLAFSPDGRSLAVGFGAGTVQLWNAISGEDLFSFKGSELEFSPDGSLMVTMPSGFYDDDFVYIYNTVDGQLLRQWEGQRAIFSPGGMLAIENNGAVRVMNIDKKIALKAFNGKSVAFSADGQSLALLDRDLIRLYRVADGSLLQVMEGSFKTITKMQFAPDGQTLAVVGEVPMCPNCLTEPQAALWRISDGTRVDLEIQDPRGLT